MQLWIFLIVSFLLMIKLFRMEFYPSEARRVRLFHSRMKSRYPDYTINPQSRRR